jgi:transposase
MAEQKGFTLDSKVVGVLPIVNHFLKRLKIMELLEKCLPPPDPRSKMAPLLALGVLLRNLIICRMPLYSVPEWAQHVVPELLDLKPEQMRLLNDDRIGGGLDRLFDVDRSALLTDFVVHMVREFEIELEQFHNDSTTITLHGQYAKADGRPVRGKPTLVITLGHNKDHRPDLKQLLWILTVSEDGAVPVHFKIADGNTEDSTTHIETWEVLRKLVGSAAFMYVADCKLCTRENLHYIAVRGGQFITVLPRSRKEDEDFKEWLQTNTPDWEEIAQFPHPRLKHGVPDIVHAVESPIPESDGFRLIWFHSTHKHERDVQSRQDAIDRALKGLQELQAKLEGPRCRITTKHGAAQAAEEAVSTAGAQRWIRYQVDQWEQETFRQETRGRPGKNTRWRRRVKSRFRLSWHTVAENIEADRRTDGIFPLVTNRKEEEISRLEVLEIYKRKQPFVEKRHHLLKNTLEATPAFLKTASRLEAFLFLSYIAVTVHALIERELRLAMTGEKIEELPLYPEGRGCKAPTMARVLDLFQNLQRHVLLKRNKAVQVFDPELEPIHKELLKLLGQSTRGYQASWKRYVS